MWERKELESYLISVPAISRISGIAEADVKVMAEEVAEELRDDVESNYIFQRKREFTGTNKHEVSITKALLSDFAKEWGQSGRKLEMVPAKDLLSGLNSRLVTAGGKAASSRALSSVVRKSEIPKELAAFLHSVDEMSV